MLKAVTVKLMTYVHNTFVVSDLFVPQDSTGGAGVCSALILAEKLEKQTFEHKQKPHMYAFI